MIYFKTKKLPKNIKDIEELLTRGFTSKSYESKTFLTTYHDQDCTQKQCHNARRSFDDLFTICKTYFPKTTKKELAKTLFTLSKKINLVASYCYTINKLVFYCKDISTYDTKKGMLRTLREHEYAKKGCGNYNYNMIKKLAS